MAKYRAYSGCEWVADVIGENEVEALKLAQQINPMVDAVELIEKIQSPMSQTG